ncbi:MAG: Ig-like domain-containing protein [Gemmatimonadaceae bacterium]|nr:Ig-like domain-containing protein [Gemmatimonadaceae bacterium]
MAFRFVRGMAMAFALQACGGGDGPPVPTTFSPTGGSTLQVNGVVATLAVPEPKVQILDAKGVGIKGLRVRWRVGTNSGVVITDSSLTDASGVALSSGWSFGTVTGTQTLTASADGVPLVTFTAQVGPGPAASLIRVGPSTQDATVNTNVAQPPSTRAEDAFGNVVPGVPILFIVASGGGTITGEQQTTNQSGVATAGSWKLGTGIGQQIARATSATASPAGFVATALAGPPADLVKAAGDNQEGVSGVAIGTPPGVRVVDAFNNPVGNIPVTFTPNANSGTVSNATVLTDPASGTAFVGSWVLGSAPTQSLVATSSSIPAKSVTFTATAVETAFDIDVRFVGDGGTPQVRQAFIAAASKWRRVIVGHVHNVAISRPAGTCVSWAPAISETVNDVVIFARIGAIDGAGQILARAGPCIYSTVDNLPITGIMEFDEADLTNVLANGTFGDVVLHEMGHVLGVGTFWTVGRSLLTDAGTAAPYFTGASARAAFAAINTVTFSGNPVPVEGNQYPVGTRDAHWRENVFGRELMQGFAKVGGMPLSRVTAASMQDLGYLVNMNAADPYSISSPILQGFPPSGFETPALFNDELRSELLGVDKDGRVVKVIPRRTP